MLAVWKHFHFASKAAVHTQQRPEMMLENRTKNMWKVMISSLNFLKTEVEMKQGKAGEASSLMITHQVYKMCADCLIAKVLNCEALWWWLGEDGNQLWKYWVAPQAMVDSISNLIIAWPVMMKDWNLTGLWSEWSLHLIISRAVWDTNCGNVASFIFSFEICCWQCNKSLSKTSSIPGGIQ